MYFGAYIANNMGPDQTFPLGAKKLKMYVKLASMQYCLRYKLPNAIADNTVKPVQNGHSKIDKIKILMTNGSLIKVEVLQNIPLEHSALLLTCIKR